MQKPPTEIRVRTPRRSTATAGAGCGGCLTTLFVAGHVATLVAGEVRSWVGFAGTGTLFTVFAVVALGYFGRVALGRETFFVSEETLVVRVSSPGFYRDHCYERKRIRSVRIATLREAPRTDSDHLGRTSLPSDYTGGVLFEADGTAVRCGEGATRKEAEAIVLALT